MQSLSRLNISVFLLLAAGVGVGCSDTVVVDEHATDAVQPILNGDPPSRPEHDAVVSIHSLFKQGQNVFVNPQIFCSGTLISPTVVLTAGHCLAGKTPSKVAVYVGDEPAVDITSHLYQVIELQVHPGFSNQTLLDDIALMRLASSVTETAPIPHLPAASALTNADVGGVLNFAGFGDDEFGAFGVKLQVDGELAGFGCGHPGCFGPVNPATQIWYYQDAAHNGGEEEGPCFGDSGGPAFVYRGSGYNQPYVAGITSWGDNNCTEFGVSTRVDAYQTFIDTFVTGSGGSGGGGSCSLLPNGSGCTSHSECCSNKCTGQPGNKTCK
jgi:secreted trypsin-like serine protease